MGEHIVITRECFPNPPATRPGGPRLHTCNWCGNEPARLFTYNGSHKVFCNIACASSYDDSLADAVRNGIHIHPVPR